jgi:PAS domain S-box-containing protein
MRLQATALETAENGIVITSPLGQIEWANPAFTRLTGYTLDEVYGRNPRLIKSGKHPPAYYRHLWETINAGRVWRGEIVNRRKDGTLYDEEMTITPLAHADGRIAHFIAIKQDVTERKRAEEALKEAHQQALESNRLKTQLLANVSHDMRTPLGAIIGFSEILNSGVFGDLNARQKNAIAEMHDSANTLLLFVNNLIGQAQFDTGKIVIKPKPFEIMELISACQSSVNLPASRKGLKMVYLIDPIMPHKLVGDLYWLRQIALNLMNNAVKYTDQGSISFRLYLPDPRHWAMEVADTGLGIDAETQAAIFEPFQQVDAAQNNERGGSGLGLAIVRELTQLMGGQVSLVSQPGSGSTFTVCFPMQPEGKAS